MSLRRSRYSSPRLAPRTASSQQRGSHAKVYAPYVPWALRAHRMAPLSGPHTSPCFPWSPCAPTRRALASLVHFQTAVLFWGAARFFSAVSGRRRQRNELAAFVLETRARKCPVAPLRPCAAPHAWARPDTQEHSHVRCGGGRPGGLRGDLPPPLPGAAAMPFDPRPPSN